MVETAVEEGMNWDLTSYFPAFNGPEMVRFKKDLDSDTRDLLDTTRTLKPLDEGNVETWEDVFVRSEDLFARLRHLASYVGCLTAADARNEAYLKEEAALTLKYAEASKLQTELLRGLKTASDEGFEALAGRESLSDAGYALGRMRREARYTMDSAREALAADLRVDGISAWGRLYDTLSGKLEFRMRFPDGREEQVPISQRRSLMENPDRRVRRAAFERGNAAWESVEDVAAAALNAISGTRLTMNRYREVPHFLEVALFQSAITRKTLDAMFEAIFSEIEVGRRIQRFRAKAMGVDKVAWYDLGAPLPFPDVSPMDWDEGKTLVQGAFARAYPALGRFTQEHVRQAVDRLRAARRQTARRFLYGIDDDFRVADIHDVQQHHGRRPDARARGRARVSQPRDARFAALREALSHDACGVGLHVRGDDPGRRRPFGPGRGRPSESRDSGLGGGTRGRLSDGHPGAVPVREERSTKSEAAEN